MQHLRVLTPPGRTSVVLEVLRAQPGATHVTLSQGAAVKPAGDLLEADVAREAVTLVVDAITDLPCGKECLITLLEVAATVSAAARQAEEDAPGLGIDAVVWEQVEARTNEESELSVSFVGLMVAAIMLAAVGILTDSPVLIVGAMVIGPDFGPVAGLVVSLVERRWQLARRSLIALAAGFPAGIVAGLALTAVVRGLGRVPTAYTRGHPLTHFVFAPDGWTLIVALVAGVAGVISLTSAKSSALVGVAVSVTTVPAAAGIGVAAATGHGEDCAKAVAQLAINLAALTVAGVLTLLLRNRRRQRLLSAT